MKRKIIAGILCSVMILGSGLTGVQAEDATGENQQAVTEEAAPDSIAETTKDDAQQADDRDTEAVVEEEQEEQQEQQQQQEEQQELKENSWRYNEGALIEDPSSSKKGRAGSVAWSKVNGQFVNSLGQVIEGAYKKGIDVSHHNGRINWEAVKNSDVDYAIIRCGYGNNSTSQDDREWLRNVQECTRLGIPFGVYIYSYAKTTQEAKSEAEHVLRLIRGYNLSYPVYFDMEDHTTVGVGKDGLTNIAKVFCETIKSAGYDVGVYANKNWWENYLTDPVFETWDKWVAQYNNKCSYQGNYSMWQCASDGTVPGISGNVDINFLFEQKEPPVAMPDGMSDIVQYTAHVQGIGWRSNSYNGHVMGTMGQSKRMEAIRITEKQDSGLGIEYAAHVQGIGWQNYVSSGAIAGTEGQSKRVEAVRIRLSGANKENYDIYYRTHVQGYGWLGWAKNGQESGTKGYSYRMEAMQIAVVAKGSQAPGDTNNCFVEKSSGISYSTHIQGLGWQGVVRNGQLSGTSGQSKRLEAIKINIEDAKYSGNVEYSTHVQTYGWQSPVINGDISGTSGQSKRLEAIKINLTGDMAANYDIYYRVHVQTIGWLGWAKNGGPAGTVGQSKRLEGIEVQLVEKNGAAPGAAADSYIEN